MEEKHFVGDLMRLLTIIIYITIIISTYDDDSNHHQNYAISKLVSVTTTIKTCYVMLFH